MNEMYDSYRNHQFFVGFVLIIKLYCTYAYSPQQLTQYLSITYFTITALICIIVSMGLLKKHDFDQFLVLEYLGILLFALTIEYSLLFPNNEITIQLISSHQLFIGFNTLLCCYLSRSKFYLQFYLKLISCCVVCQACIIIYPLIPNTELNSIGWIQSHCQQYLKYASIYYVVQIINTLCFQTQAKQLMIERINTLASRIKTSLLHFLLLPMLFYRCKWIRFYSVEENGFLPNQNKKQFISQLTALTQQLLYWSLVSITIIGITSIILFMYKLENCNQHQTKMVIERKQNRQLKQLKQQQTELRNQIKEKAKRFEELQSRIKKEEIKESERRYAEKQEVKRGQQMKNDKCVICRQHKKNSVNINCGHLSFCQSWSRTVNQCSLCKNAGQQIKAKA